jgi:hypothetical protein
MDRVERIGPRSPQWLQQPALDPDRDVLAERRRREDERRRRRSPLPPDAPASDEDDPPHHIDVRA